jgi:hypothetical protein
MPVIPATQEAKGDKRITNSRPAQAMLARPYRKEGKKESLTFQNQEVY